MKILRIKAYIYISYSNTLDVRTLVENCPVKMSCHMQF